MFAEIEVGPSVRDIQEPFPSTFGFDNAYVFQALNDGKALTDTCYSCDAQTFDTRDITIQDHRAYHSGKQVPVHERLLHARIISTATVSFEVAFLPGHWWPQIDLIQGNASYPCCILDTACPNHEDVLRFLPFTLALMFYRQGLHGSKDDIQEKEYHLS